MSGSVASPTPLDQLQSLALAAVAQFPPIVGACRLRRATLENANVGAAPVYVQLHDAGVPLVGAEVPLAEFQIDNVIEAAESPSGTPLRGRLSLDAPIAFAAGCVVALSSTAGSFTAVPALVGVVVVDSLI